jgi:ABC-type ATPase with predicted acetyltransferase domain
MHPKHSKNSLDFNIIVPIPRVRSARAGEVARWFGLEIPKDEQTKGPAPIAPALNEFLPKPGEILLITGPSGAGKSSLLRAMCAGLDGWIDLNHLTLPDAPLVDCFGDLPLIKVLEVLSRVGLAEAWTYLRKPCELSDGQRWRLRLALGLVYAQAEGVGNNILICDEFCALLDRVSACVVARSLRRAITDARLGAIVATSHDDLLNALEPDMHMRCDFGSVCVDPAT